MRILRADRSGKHCLLARRPALLQRDPRAVIGHTRFTTQGSEKRNCNNHPFEGRCGTESFALAHNGVLYNDRELRREQHLPPTPIENEPSIVYGGKKYTEYKD